MNQLIKPRKNNFWSAVKLKLLIDGITKIIRKDKDQIFSGLNEKIPQFITPNLLVYLRIFFTLIILILFINNITAIFYWGLGFYLFCKFLDLIDGRLARYRKQQTPFGEIIDPLSDRLLNLVGLAILIKLWQIQALWLYFFVNLISIIIFLINLLLLSTNLIKSLKFNYFRKIFEIGGLILTVVLLIFELI